MNFREILGRVTAIAGVPSGVAITALFAMGLEAVTGMTPAAHAQDRVEQIIVTATKRESTVQEVPFSINVQSQEEIQRAGALSLEDLSRNIAGLTIQNLGPGQSQVAIRGVSAGQIVRDQPGVKEQVGIYLDETVISLSLFTPDIDLYDLARVETLRGPQGTLFGSGSVGGTIRYITNQPLLEEFEASVEADLHTLSDGDPGGHLKGMVNLPLAEGRAALRAVGYVTEYAGFIDALGEGGTRNEDVNSGSRTGGRLMLGWQVSDNLMITPRLLFQRIEADGFNRQEVYNLYANPFTTTRPAIQLGEREQYLLLDEAYEDDLLIADLTAEASFDWFDATLTTSYTERDVLVSRDASALSGSVSVDFGFPDAGVLLPSNLRDTTAFEQITGELRFSSNTEGPLQWLVGVFYADNSRDYAQRLPTPGYDAFVDADPDFGPGTSAALANGFPADSPFNSDLPYDLEQIAVFGEASYEVTDRLHVTAGGRFYDYEEQRSILQGGIFSSLADQFDETSADGFTPRIMASYDFSDTVTFNAQASQGFRLGGVNDPLNVPLCTDEDEAIFGRFQSYEDETLWNYEVGVKSSFDNGIQLNAAAFYADIEDLQVTLDAGSCSSRISFNVPEAHTTGVELELGAQPIDNLDLSFAGSYIEAEFDSTVVAPSTGQVLGGIQEGNRLASVPEMQFAAVGTYYFPLAWAPADSEPFVSATLQYVGDRYTQPSDQVPGAGVFVSGLPFGGATGNEPTIVDLELDAYEIFNLRAGLASDTWEAVVYVDNVFDENANLSFDRERGGRARLGFRTNQPRTFGITFRMNY
ncbi:MAG TPA: TonB-dependent receptor [Woeseiaceae bacterium]|nr:TonB-dependent receptor [Woeseiaceae bacterium]